MLLQPNTVSKQLEYEASIWHLSDAIARQEPLTLTFSNHEPLYFCCLCSAGCVVLCFVLLLPARWPVKHSYCPDQNASWARLAAASGLSGNACRTGAVEPNSVAAPLFLVLVVDS